MLKYVVVAVFSICVLPCFAAAQDCGCSGESVMAAPMVSDCGCEAAPEPSCCAPALTVAVAQNQRWFALAKLFAVQSCHWLTLQLVSVAAVQVVACEA